MKIKIFLLSAFCLLFSFSVSHAASLYVNPPSVSIPVGSTFNMTVRTDTQGQAVNTAEASVSFSTDVLELVKVSPSSLFYLQAPGSPAKGNGTVYFGGGLPTPGYTGANGVVGTMTFRARREGSATVSITGGKVLLNDGTGADALSATAAATVSVLAPAVGPVEVSSESHPDPEKWYNSKDVSLSWSRPDGAYGFSFELDQNPDSAPDNTLDTTITTSKSFSDLSDGTWYFHIKARKQSAAAGFGVTQIFKIQIDTAPPAVPQVKLVGQSDLKDVTRTPTINFETADALSGTDHYEIYLDDKLVDTVTSNPYTFSKLDTGPHVIKVIAYDKAGNSSSASLPIIVTGPAPILGGAWFSVTYQVPFPILVMIGVLVLLLNLIILWLLLRKQKRRDVSSEIENLQAEIDTSLERMKLDINRKVIKLMQRISADSYGEEEKFSREVASQVRGTRKKIDRKLSEAGRAAKNRPSRRIQLID